MKNETLHFEIGGNPGPSDCVSLRDGRIHCYTGIFFAMYESPRVIAPNKQAWQNFWVAMEEVGVWNWQERYYNYGILDGSRWDLKISHQGRHLDCKGLNMYPPSQCCDWSDDSEFGRFITALRRLNGWDSLGNCEHNVLRSGV